MLTHATPTAWGLNLQHAQYGTDDTYQLAANWLEDCATVADWGGGAGYFREFLRPDQSYTCVDGTAYSAQTVLADLTTWRQVADGILLRHVLDQSEQWRAMLQNALTSCRHRLVVVTFTPDATWTHRAKVKSGWPVMHFDPSDLRQVMGAWLVGEWSMKTSHPERIYYLERPA